MFRQLVILAQDLAGRAGRSRNKEFSDVPVEDWIHEDDLKILFDESRAIVERAFGADSAQRRHLEQVIIGEDTSRSEDGYDPFAAMYIRLTRLVVLLRTFDAQLEAPAVTPQGDRTRSSQITILFLASNPVDTDHLRLDEETRAISESLREADFREQFRLEQQWAVRIEDLQRSLLRHQPDIVHFSGHGTATSEIVLEDAGGRGLAVPASALSELFSVLKDNVRCVVLNACYSERQANAIADHVDFVVGMTTAVGDQAAVAFASSFYAGLAYGRSIQTSFDLGRNSISLVGLKEADTPRLLSLRSDPARVSLVAR